ncbi:MAG: tRNA lysidine(34) synthetase TilS [Flavobacteriales bacterium]|nr:tRNA lysidine(34) synthetase TilS [Flavobacteriales bacterium]|tara:strand:+ start:1601 stop:2917 length:1317 start_codon:yes stop_codon:yes gene_type:complete
MNRQVYNYIISNNLFSIKKDKIILAISAGADSVCLFHMFRSFGVNMELAHCNFKLRDNHSDEDEDFIKNLGNKYEIKFHIKSFETASYAKKNNLSIQMAARQLRYNWFNSLLINRNANYIATAHHKDDSIETFFINLIRGSGIRGLVGIKQTDKIIRPFLSIEKNQIINFLNKNKFKYREDITNSSLKYLRNKIRIKLIPLLLNLNPSIKENIFNEMKILENTSIVFSDYVNQIRQKIVVQKSDAFYINISSLNKLSPLKIYLFELLRPFGFMKVDDVISSLNGQSGKTFYSRTHKLIIDRDSIIITKNQDITSKQYTLEENINFKNENFSIKFSTSKKINFSLNKDVAELDYSKINFPLKLRKWKFGDSFIPLGMKNYKKISDFFIDEKFSLVQKEKQWILCDKKNIIWIVGYRIDDRYKVTSNTKKLYIAKVLYEN